ncbi:MAG: hypothetical protein LBL40_01860 [Coxiellaceae bacterium]|jgi:HemY protein|nr:hypothetical protein [Coxiellaceae bacterium]
MKKTLFYFLILLLTVWFEVMMRSYHGYVLITINNISVETSLWFAIVILIFLFIIFYIILRFKDGISAISSYIKRQFNDYQKKFAHKQTVAGLYDLIEGNWSRAEKKILRSANHSDMPIVNYLAATFMIKHRYTIKRRNSYSCLMQQISQDNQIVVGLTQASLQISNYLWQQAILTLQDLYRLRPKNIFVLQLLQQVYLELKDWDGLKKILPLLKRYQIREIDYINNLEERIYRELFIIGSSNGDIDDLWSNLPGYLKKKSTLVAIYTKYLIDHNRNEDAELILKVVLHRNFDDGLLNLYATLSPVQPIKYLNRAEKWLQNHQENPSLLLCLGRICREQKLWGKALYYLERSVKLKPTIGVYIELGRIMTLQHDWKKAIAFYEKAAQLSLNGM